MKNRKNVFLPPGHFTEHAGDVVSCGNGWRRLLAISGLFPTSLFACGGAWESKAGSCDASQLAVATVRGCASSWLWEAKEGRHPEKQGGRWRRRTRRGCCRRKLRRGPFYGWEFLIGRLWFPNSVFGFWSAASGDPNIPLLYQSFCLHHKNWCFLFVLPIIVSHYSILSLEISTTQKNHPSVKHVLKNANRHHCRLVKGNWPG